MLDNPGWKRLKHLAVNRDRLLRLIHKAKVSPSSPSKVYHFGVLVPKTVTQALELDKTNGLPFGKMP